MPAPTFELVTRGTAPTQYVQESDFEGAVNTALGLLWLDVITGGGKQFASRAQALAMGQDNLPLALRMITTMESGVLTYRVPGSRVDDPLFSDSSPYWGVVLRVDPEIAVAAASAAAQAQLDVRETAGNLAAFEILLEASDRLEDGSYPVILFNGAPALFWHGDKWVGPGLGEGGAMPPAQAPAGGWAAVNVGTEESPIIEFTASSGRGKVSRFRDVGGDWVPVTPNARVICHIGQSNAGITSSTETPRTYWTRPDARYHTRTLNDFASNIGGLRGLAGAVPVTTPTGLVQAVEVSSIQSVLSATSQALYMLDGVSPRVNVVRSEARGSQAMIGADNDFRSGIWKNAAGDISQIAINFVASLRYQHNLAIAQGYSVPAIYAVLTHQETDGGLARGVYADDQHFGGFKAWCEAQLADLGKPVVWFCDQACGPAVGHGAGGQWPVKMDVVNEMAAMPNVHLTVPRYHIAMSYGVDSMTVLDPAHHGNEARMILGESIGHAIKAYEDGRRWYCPKIVSHAVSGNSVVLDYNALLPLIIDPAFCAAHADMGFSFQDGDGPGVTSVAQTGTRQITVSFAGSPVGKRLWYAGRPGADNSRPCEFSRSRGAIRDVFEADSAIFSGRKILRPAWSQYIDL